MIRKLKIRLIILTMISVFLLLAFLVSGMNIVNYSSLVREADNILSQLAETPNAFSYENSKPIGKPNDPHGSHLPDKPFSAIPSETRFFTVIANAEGEILYTDLSQIGSVSEETAAAYAAQVLGGNEDRGFLGSFRYLRTESDRAVYVFFLDFGHQLDSFHMFLNVSTAIAAIGFLIVLLVFCFFATRIIRPIAESYEKQKRFITDAGHEIKTPLTIINANVDILEMELEPDANESLSDIRQQTKRLTTLTNDLVFLARMEESEHSMTMVEFPISETVRETAEPFRALAQAADKNWICDIHPMLTLKGNDKSIRQLVSVLLDNALKYSPQGGTVALRLFPQGHTVVLTVFNTTTVPIKQETLSRVFDRFYRTDPSRNSETGGHGIGLSIAKAIVNAHGGKIVATSEDEHSFRITVTLSN